MFAARIGCTYKAQHPEVCVCGMCMYRGMCLEVCVVFGMCLEVCVVFVARIGCTHIRPNIQRHVFVACVCVSKRCVCCVVFVACVSV